jgi:hypothetical protein
MEMEDAFRSDIERTASVRLRREVARFSAIVLIAMILIMPGAPLPASVPGDDLDEVLVFDSKGDEKGYDEGLVRKRLGLLDANGKPQVGAGGNPVPLVSANGKKKGYDMKDGKGTKLKDAADNLKGDGGTLTLITHGGTGTIEVDGVRRPGFGTGTGKKDKCTVPPPAQLNGIGAKKNVTVNLAVCYGEDTETGVTSVASSLQGEIVSLGGSVSTMNADPDGCPVRRAATYTGNLTQAEIGAANTAFWAWAAQTYAFKDHYKKLQEALDAAIGAGKATAVISYKAIIDTEVIETLPSFADSIAVDEDDSYPCYPVCSVNSIPSTSEWGLVILTFLLLAAGGALIRRRMACVTK